jgi:hypothetical protein
MTATLSILFAAATKECGKLLGFHVLSLAGRDAIGNRGGNNV